MARIVHVDLDAFFVVVCRQNHPELRDVELLVVGGRRDQRGVVQSASHAARRFGIHAGMPIAEAVQLCPQATFFQGAFMQYREASHAVRAVLEDFSPIVVMSSLDEAYLGFSGTEQLYPVSLLPVTRHYAMTRSPEPVSTQVWGSGPTGWWQSWPRITRSHGD